MIDIAQANRFIEGLPDSEPVPVTARWMRQALAELPDDTVVCVSSTWMRKATAELASMRVVGSKRYVRLYRRNDPQGPWSAITVDVAAGELP